MLRGTSDLIPFVVPGIVVAIGGDRQSSPAVWFLAAVGFAFTTAALWEGEPAGVLLGVPLFIVGSMLANTIWSVVIVPTRRGVLRLTALAGITMPALTGVADLILCARIP